ncbi:MAG: ATP-binding domain-containing protein, partial [Verrucomicrobia bacterium]|nr:ATP-binding domain-containing protein [Verrucomicrobiota bacterium]
DVNLLRIINTPARGIGSSTTELAIHESQRAGKSIFETLQMPAFLELVSAKTRAAIEAFVSVMDGFETAAQQPLADLSHLAGRLLAETGYLQDLRRTCKTPDEAANREENVREMIRALAEYQSRSTDGLAGFLAETVLNQEREEGKDDGREGITLITLHAAKGLEFQHVFLVGVEEGILPHDRSKLEGSLDEERRLLYVGMTRARQTLTLTHCRARRRYGSASPCSPSSFLKEMDERFVERIHFHALANAPASEDTARSHFARLKQLLSGDRN